MLLLLFFVPKEQGWLLTESDGSVSARGVIAASKDEVDGRDGYFFGIAATTCNAAPISPGQEAMHSMHLHLCLYLVKEAKSKSRSVLPWSLLSTRFATAPNWTAARKGAATP